MKKLILAILAFLLLANSAYAFSIVEVRIRDNDGDTLSINSDGTLTAK